MDSNELTLGYWPIRGRAGSIRSLLAYCGIPYKTKFYNTMEEWFVQDKQNLGLDYPNLPYLIDGDKKITEAIAILYHIALKAGKRELIGDTDDKFIKVQTVFGVVSDLRQELGKLAWTKGDFETEKKESFTNGIVKNKLEVLNKNLEGKEWICGFFSIADFYLFEAIEIADAMEPLTLEKYPNLASFRKRFSEIPEYKAHRQSSDYINVIFMPGKATWTNA